MEPYLGLLAAIAIGVGLSIGQLIFARRTGLAPYQGSLVQTLQSNVAALTTRVDQLEHDLKAERDMRLAAESRADELDDTVARQAREITRLRQRLGIANGD